MAENDPRARGAVKRTTAEWMQNNIVQPNGMPPPTFRSEVGFVSEEQDQQFRIEHAEIWSEALVEAKRLAVLIAETQEKLCKHDASFRPIDPQNFTLPRLLNALEKNRDAYENDELNGAKGFLRKGFRKMGENANSFKIWLEMIPKDTWYTAPIAGGFIVFLTLADRMHKVREDVFKMMTAVPEDFNDLKDYLAVYEEVYDRKLQACGANVCTSIFRTLQQAMRFMGENPFKKAFKALKGEKYEEEISDSIEKLKESKANFKSQIDKCLHTRVGTLFRLAKDSSILQQMMICEVLACKDQAVNAINSSNQDLCGQMQGLRDVIMNAMYNKLLTDRDSLADMAARKVIEMQHQDQKRLRSSVGLSELMKILDFNDKDPTLDLMQCLRKGKELSDDDINRLSWIKNTSALRSWLIEAKSDCLMIEGNIDSPYSYTSALSILCAEMAHLFQAIQNTIVVSHFCGLQARPGANRLADAKGMMNSLIGQLLEYSEVLDGARVDNSVFHGVERAELSSLNETFDALIFQLPKSWTVVVLVDTISLYETLQRLQPTLEAIRYLRKLVKRTKKRDDGPILKLLVTAPKRSLYVAREFSDKHRIVVTEDPAANVLLKPDLKDIINTGTL